MKLITWSDLAIWMKFSEMLVPIDKDENDDMVETKPCG
jgi:hypothetical protein